MSENEQGALFNEESVAEADVVQSTATDTAVEQQQAATPAGNGGGNGATRSFAPLPPMPEGDAIDVAAYAERAYLEYAVSVVKGRALPDVTDGQKPVQRRILFAMREMGLRHDSKHVKSARVVGEVLGKLHPHGDSSAYEAMVRLAQDFSMRYPLVDGQGNFGSRDGDNAAAMRYTEARLTPISDLLLSELDMGTVDMVPNYDGHFNEPAQLPARLPMALLNGATGIAVGMATSIPSHNLREIGNAAAHCVRNPKCSDDELLDFVTGPDLPGGGQVISSPTEIRESYRSGRGSLKMRARWTVEELARGQWRIAVYELPHDTSTQKVLEEIEELTNPKVKAGKKSLSQEQNQKKQLILSVLDRVADESDKDHAVRLVLEPKSSRQSPDELMNVLLAHTSLECSLSVNMVMIGIDGRPQQKPLAIALREWSEFRVGTVRRRCEFRLGKVNDRIHILEGRMIVFLNIDEVIAIIRESDEPKAALIERFSLSEQQAEDILDIRLRQLARMEGIKIEKELKELNEEKGRLEKLLGSEARMRTQVAKEIDADVASYGDERRTLIEEAERIAPAAAKVADEPVTVIVSNKYWVRARQGHGLDLSNTSFKDGDGMQAAYECRTTDHCIVICDNGRVCSVPVHLLPSGRGDGAPIATFIELAAGAKIAHVICGNAAQHVLIATAAGYGFTCTLGDMVGRTKAGKQFITTNEAILPPALFTPSDTAIVTAVSRKGRLLAFLLQEMKVLSGGGKGVIVMELDKGDAMAGALVTAQPSVSLEIKGGRNLSIKEAELQSCFGKRARKGKSIGLKQKTEVTGVIAQ